ncbi:ABC transporter permease [Paenibacillus arenilitoris]|uniref:ABC transporter permease n=1 Tax=Paenibacillus arenilitoris TaxID=2772299 RepID=A0A927CK02_9BACL|nr:ABC transporter permease [Paenibacillus arenilitoris]MBD2867296.1 ABC transporter permease [Paenibacillus arenilitoris]
MNRRQKTLIYASFSAFLLIAVMAAGSFLTEEATRVDFARKNLLPSLGHIYGTDWFGRDMFIRTVKGLSLSIVIGALSTIGSGLIALMMGTAAAIGGRRVDACVNWLIDVVMGVPMLIFLILVSFIVGKGPQGIIVGMILTHWTYLARVVRAEVLQLKSSQYVIAARSMGKSNAYIALRHILPHAYPQFLVGLILMFPHTILHEASLTFLGFGLSPHQPGIGVILSESLNYLSAGQWWTALMPGLSLLVIVRLFDLLGDSIQSLYNPYKSHE